MHSVLCAQSIIRAQTHTHTHTHTEHITVYYTHTYNSAHTHTHKHTGLKFQGAAILIVGAPPPARGGVPRVQSGLACVCVTAFVRLGFVVGLEHRGVVVAIRVFERSPRNAGMECRTAWAERDPRGDPPL